MTAPADLVFLVDVDNTLLDNDPIGNDIRQHLRKSVGVEHAEQYWATFEEIRSELGYADYLGALQKYRVEHPHDPNILEVSSFLLDYAFSNRLYPGALNVIARFREFGPTVILTDGDVVFQPRKVQRSGLWEAVRGNVLIYIHKEQMLDDVEERYPAHHYVMVDDKLRILAAMKDVWGDRLTTIFPRQGHYALDAHILASYPPADVSIERIGDLNDMELEDILGRQASV